MVVALELPRRPADRLTVVELDHQVDRRRPRSSRPGARACGHLLGWNRSRSIVACARRLNVRIPAYLDDGVRTHGLKVLDLDAFASGVGAQEVVGCAATRQAQFAWPEPDRAIGGRATRGREHGLPGSAQS